ncbi:MAG: serine hydrolase [Cardiobacteriaceae bacterium]|nr:serine hydrolase [Cardiobacteriaceae bacterium]
MLSKRAFLARSAALAAGGLLAPQLAFAQNVQEAVNQRVRQMRAQGLLAADEKTAWQVTDLRARRSVVSLNANASLQAASMVKPLVIQAYLMCHYHKDPVLYPLSPRVMNEMREMIVTSNNEFTNHIIKRLGGPQGVQWMLKKEAPHIFRDIHIVEYIPEGGRTYQNRASAADYDRFLQALWSRSLPGAEQLLAMMAIPNNDRIRTKTRFVPQSASVFDKTGSTAMLCGNTGIIECRDAAGNRYPYTFTGIIEKQRKVDNYASWITSRSNRMREISDLVYQHFSRAYRLIG